jgi:hypothetical protein
MAPPETSARAAARLSAAAQGSFAWPVAGQGTHGLGRSSRMHDDAGALHDAHHLRIHGRSKIMM